MSITQYSPGRLVLPHEQRNRPPQDSRASSRTLAMANQNFVAVSSEDVTAHGTERRVTICAGIRDHVVTAVELKFNCFFLMPLIDSFPTRLREELEAAYDEDLDEVRNPQPSARRLMAWFVIRPAPTAASGRRAAPGDALLLSQSFLHNRHRPSVAA